jgi:hypothetical protein
MATERPESHNVTISGAETITLDKLVASASQAVLRAIQDHSSPQPQPWRPRIWVGITVDLEQIGELGRNE